MIQKATSTDCAPTVTSTPSLKTQEDENVSSRLRNPVSSLIFDLCCQPHLSSVVMCNAIILTKLTIPNLLITIIKIITTCPLWLHEKWPYQCRELFSQQPLPSPCPKGPSAGPLGTHHRLVDVYDDNDNDSDDDDDYDDGDYNFDDNDNEMTLARIMRPAPASEAPSTYGLSACKRAPTWWYVAMMIMTMKTAIIMMMTAIMMLMMATMIYI